MMSSTPKPITCVLNGPGDWNEWMDSIETAAKIAKIWQYVNPETTREAQPALAEPAYPVPSDVKAGAQRLQDLSPVEREELQARRHLWNQQHAKWERQEEALAQMESRIRESIAKSFLSYTRKCEDAHEMLTKLKDRFKPTNDTRKDEVIAKYQQLQRPPKQNINRDQFPTLHQIIQKFRDTRSKPKTRGSIFSASFQGKGADDGDETPKKRDCLCGKKHLFKNCPYLIESKRPTGWKPDPEIQRNIDQKLEKIPKLRNAVEVIQKQESSKKKETSESSGESPSKPTSFVTATLLQGPEEPIHSPAVLTMRAIPEYSLRDSFILDSGATIHVCNNRDRFKTFQSAGINDYLYAGDSTVAIEGVGDVDIQITTSDGVSTITLRNTAYVPQFHTNTVSLNKFIEKGVHWNTESHELTYRGVPYCRVEKHYGQWVLEYNDRSVDNMVFATKSMILRTATAS